MTETNRFEKQFFNALRDIFVGAKVEGDSGFVNLMRIKSRYYEQGVFPQLQNDISGALEPFPDFREELFDKLYTFFQRYFSESGSIYFRYTALHQNVYEKVYTDDRDVILFWKTHMLYYVKTDRIFNSLNVEVDDAKFIFDASKMTLKKSNEKREVIYSFRKIQPEDGTLVFDVAYSERGRTTKVDDILKEIKKAGMLLDDETLNKAFRVFEKQSEVDFFINKDARAFLREQFDLWMYQYLFEGQNVWGAERLTQLQALKGIAYKIIDFISQFEDELVKIWNKPKFVRNSHYVVTLDKLTDSQLMEKILTHPNLPQQTQEWRDLGLIRDNFIPDFLTLKDMAGAPRHKQYKSLPIDTKYFPDIELEILALFDDLDAALDGWLVHSENYQALMTMRPKFQGRIQSIYIDPPFNLDSSDQFQYRTNYKDSNWATLLENRLRIVKDFLNDKGHIFVRCDYNGNWIVRPLMAEIFSQKNYKNEIIVNRFKRQLNDLTKLNFATEYLYYFTKSEKSRINKVLKPRTCTFCGNLLDPKWRPMTSPGIRWSIIDESRANLIGSEFCKKEKGNFVTVARIVGDKVFIPPRGRHWTFNQEKIDELIKQKRIRVVDNTLEYLQTEETPIDTSWTDLKGYEFGSEFSTENAEELIARVFDLTTEKNDLVMDFFLGSGTSVDIAQKMGRKWIGIEMADYFFTYALPNMKKVINKTSGFFKYYDLEQYEETLYKSNYADSDLFNNPYIDPYHSYVFLRDLKMLDSVEIDKEQNKALFHPERLYPDPSSPNGTSIDLAETLSQRRGKWIKRITAEYVEFEDGERMSLTAPDWQTIKPLVWWQ